MQPIAQKVPIEVESPQEVEDDRRSEEIDIAVPPHFSDSVPSESGAEADCSGAKPAPWRPGKLRAEEMVQNAMDLLELQIFEDPDIIVGHYFFRIEQCPKSDHQAYLMVAKQIESVIQEESEEVSESLHTSMARDKANLPASQ